MMKTLFMGTPELAATILNQLCDAKLAPLAVITQTAKAVGRGQKVVPSPVEKVATERKIPVIATDNVNTAEHLMQLKKYEPDIFLVAAFGQILKAEVLALPRLFSLNVHGSLLPKYRGASPVQRAIWNGDDDTGVTIQKIAKKLDSGDILLCKRTPINPLENSEELMARIAKLGGEALIEALRLIEGGQYEFAPQDEKLATYAGKISKEDARVNWESAAKEIVNQVRALNPWPVAETTLEGTRLKIYRATPGEGFDKKPGELLVDKSSLRVQCGGNTAVSLTEIQLENKKRLGIKEFLAGFRGSFPFSKAGT